MFGRLLARGVPAETRRYIGSNTAYLTRDQPLTALTIKCLAARTSSALPALVLPSFRCYATAPKSTTAKKTTTSKKAPATKSTTKPKPKTATKSKAKPKAKAKPKKKPAAKRKKTTTKRKPKTEKTELQKKRTKVNQLRKIALLHPPKLLPTNSFLVYSAQHKNAGAKVTENAKANGAAFRNLSASEKERYVSVASQNTKANAVTMKKWIASHTPLEIQVANRARRSLNRIAKEPKPAGASTALVAHAVFLLKDDRRLKKPSIPYISFVTERWASGDMKDVPIADAAKSMSAEWRQLSDSQKQKYVDEYESAKAQYHKEYEQVHGKLPGTTKSQKKIKAAL